MADFLNGPAAAAMRMEAKAWNALVKGSKKDVKTEMKEKGGTLKC